MYNYMYLFILSSRVFLRFDLTFAIMDILYFLKFSCKISQFHSFVIIILLFSIYFNTLIDPHVDFLLQ